MRHKNRTSRGDELIEQHQERYESWWLGKYADLNVVVNGIPARGKIVKVNYIGNSVYGPVLLTLQNGCEVGAPMFGSGRPRKRDLKVYETEEEMNEDLA